MGENTRMAAASAATAANAALAASAAANYYSTIAAGVAGTAVGGAFSSAEGGALKLYERTGTSPFYAEIGELDGVWRADLAADTGAALVGTATGETVQERLDALNVASRTALAALVAYSGASATLTEPGREGAFIFSAANLSAEVSADTYQGLYVAPASDATGASGAWVRQVQIAPYVSPQYRASWWGLGTSAASTNHLRLKAAHDLIPAGATLILPNETFATQGLSGTNCLLAITKAMRLTGAGAACKLDLSHATARTGSGIVVLASNVEIDGFEITGHHVARGADPWFNIFIGARFRYTTSSKVIENVKVHDMRISDGTAAIAIHHAVWLEGGVQVQYSPTRIKIYDNTITGMDYRGIVPEADQIEIYGNTVIMDTGVTYADVGHAAFRVIGCDDVAIHDNFVVPHPGTPAFILTGSGIDGAHNVGVATWFRDARNVRIYGNTVQGKCTNGFQVEKVGKSIEIYDNTLDADITATDSHRAMLFLGNTAYVAQAEIVVRDNKARGFNTLCLLSAGYFKTVAILNNEVLGNSKTGTLYDGATFICSNGNIAGIEFLRMRGNSHLAHESLIGYPIYLNVMQSGTFSFEDNLLPTPPGGTGGNVVAFISPVTANVRVSPSDAFSTITATTYYNGSNRYWPAGSFAGAVDDIIASPRATA